MTRSWWLVSSGDNSLMLPPGAVLDMNADVGVFSDTGASVPITEGGEVLRMRDQGPDSLLFSNVGAGIIWNGNQVNGHAALDFPTGGAMRNASGFSDLISGPREIMVAVVQKAANNGSVFGVTEGGGTTDKWFFANGVFGITGFHLNGSSGSVILTGGMPGADNTWHLIMFRRKSTGDWEFWRDGVQTNTGNSVVDISTPNTGDISFGTVEGNFQGKLSRGVAYEVADDDSKWDAFRAYMEFEYV